VLDIAVISSFNGFLQTIITDYFGYISGVNQNCRALKIKMNFCLFIYLIF